MSVARTRILEESWTADQIQNHPDSTIGQAVRSVAGGQPGPGGGTVAGAGPVVRLATIPGLLANQRRDQQSVYSQDNVTTDTDGTFYSVTLDEEQHAIVRKHDPSGRVVEDFDLHGLAGNPFGPQGDDSHNTWVIAIDHLGNILVAGNTRATTLRMARTTTPGDLSTFQFVTDPLPPAYNSITYPTFARKDNGRIVFAAGQGFAAGGRNWFWAEWDGTGFGAVQVLIDGISSSQGAYLHRLAIRGNKVSLGFMWRSGTTGDGNVDFGYAEQVNGVWQKADGSTQPMPITPSNADVVVPFDFGSGALNQGGASIDNDGNPHFGLMFFDADGATQIHHVWFDGDTWHNDAVTQLTRRMELGTGVIAELSPSRPQVICTDAGRTIMIVRITHDGHGGRPLGMDVTPGADTTPFRFADLDLAGWEPAYDERALREHNTLRMLVTSIDHAKSSKKGWVAQWGGILSVDLDRIGDVASGAASIPTIKPVAGYSIPTLLPVVANNTTEAAIPELGQAIITSDEHLPGVPYFVKVTGVFNLVSDTRTTEQRALDISEGRPGVRIWFVLAGLTDEVCQLNMVQQSQAGSRSTPWEPIPTTITGAADVRRVLRLSARGVSGVNVGGTSVHAFRVEIGTLGWT